MVFLADFSFPAMIGVLTGFGLVVVLPLVSILLNHQRKMAELFRGKDDDRSLSTDRRLDQVEREMVLLRQQLTDNILAFDDQRTSNLQSPPPTPEQRLGLS
jgi:hypothetical protein